MEANHSHNKQRMRANERVEKRGELTEKTLHFFFPPLLPYLLRLLVKVEELEML